MKKLVAGKFAKLIALAVLTVISPIAGFCQGPGGPGGGGPDVPFDDDMNIAFLVAGVLFAAFVVFKRLRKKAIA